MYTYRSVATAHAVVTSAVLFLLLLPRQAPAQQMDPAMQPEAGHQMQHRMFRLPLGDWDVVGMGQVFPVVTTGGPDNGEGGELRRTEWYLTQPAPLANLERPSRRLVLRTTRCDALAHRHGGLRPAAEFRPVSLRPFLEVQYHRGCADRGDVPRGRLVILGVVPASEALPGRRPSAKRELLGSGSDDDDGAGDVQLMGDARTLMLREG